MVTAAQTAPPALGEVVFFSVELECCLYVVCCSVTWLVFLDIPQVCLWLDVEVVLCCVLWFTKAGVLRFSLVVAAKCFPDLYVSSSL